MKKILCMVLIAVMLMSVCLITISAEVVAENSGETINTPPTSTADEADNWLFFQLFSDRFAYPEDRDPVAFYEELYYHYDENGNVEWALIYGGKTLHEPWNMKCCAVLEDRVIRDPHKIIGVFSCDYGIYDVNKQDFFDIGTAMEDEKYHDEIYAYLNENNIGEIIGDMDNDRKLTVKDATYIQKCLANIIEFPESDAVSADFWYTEGYGHLAYISDFNRDDVRNIKDATAIQKYLAGVE
ncbi:MAG: hypothetical protein E7566_04140 [Ruminococcaceae bacterium]|nr:hypothetical protein [Oscillospiraceae bacterium]